MFLNLVQQFSELTRGFDRRADIGRTHSSVWPVHSFDFDCNKTRWSSGFDGRIVDCKSAGRVPSSNNEKGTLDLRMCQGVGCRSFRFQNEMRPVVYTSIAFADILVNQTSWLIYIRILQIHMHARGCGRIHDHRMYHYLHGVVTCHCQRSYQVATIRRQSITGIDANRASTAVMWTSSVPSTSCWRRYD